MLIFSLDELAPPLTVTQLNRGPDEPFMFDNSPRTSSRSNSPIPGSDERNTSQNPLRLYPATSSVSIADDTVLARERKRLKEGSSFRETSTSESMVRLTGRLQFVCLLGGGRGGRVLCLFESSFVCSFVSLFLRSIVFVGVCVCFLLSHVVVGVVFTGLCSGIERASVGEWRELPLAVSVSVWGILARDAQFSLCSTRDGAGEGESD